MANKKKAATTVVAVATAAALLLGGTFAWQSISQRALNEASDVINPGGRLHNDLWYEDAKTTNNDIYVENFTDLDADGDDIYARVRLSEYMEIVMNYGTAAEKVETVAGSKMLDGAVVTDKATDNTSSYDYDYTIHYFGEENATDTYWEWTMGNEDSETVYYMPTFNLNKDSLAPDLNGLYCDRVGGISNREMGQYVDVDGNALEDYEGYSNGELLTGFEIYDGDTNSSDEIGTDPLVLADIIENGETSQYNDAAAVVLTDDVVEHEAKPVGATKGLVSIEEWLGWFDNGDGTYNYEKYENGDYGNYWVYDTDGWVYWSGAIGAGETTGLLLDSFTLKEVMDDTWYYAIEAEGEFVTADDLGEYNPDAAAATFNLRNTPVASPSDLTYYDGGTGFYENGISKEALALLSIIGVDVYGEAEDEGEGEPDYTFDLGDALPEKAPVVPLNSTIAVNAPVEMANPVLGVTAYKPYNLESFPIVDDEVDISGSKLMNSTSPIGLTINEDYTYENGLLTITNPEYVNTVVALLMSDGPAGQGVKTYKHAVFVVEGESSGGEGEVENTALPMAMTLTYEGVELDKDDEGNYVFTAPADYPSVQIQMNGGKISYEGSEFDSNRTYYHAHGTDTVNAALREGERDYLVTSLDGEELMTVSHPDGVVSVYPTNAAYTVKLQVEGYYDVDGDESDDLAEGSVYLTVIPTGGETNEENTINITLEGWDVYIQNEPGIYKIVGTENVAITGITAVDADGGELTGIITNENGDYYITLSADQNTRSFVAGQNDIKLTIIHDENNWSTETIVHIDVLTDDYHIFYGEGAPLTDNASIEYYNETRISSELEDVEWVLKDGDGNDVTETDLAISNEDAGSCASVSINWHEHQEYEGKKYILTATLGEEVYTLNLTFHFNAQDSDY